MQYDPKSSWELHVTVVIRVDTVINPDTFFTDKPVDVYPHDTSLDLSKKFLFCYISLLLDNLNRIKNAHLLFPDVTCFGLRNKSRLFFGGVFNDVISSGNLLQNYISCFLYYFIYTVLDAFLAGLVPAFFPPVNA